MIFVIKTHPHLTLPTPPLRGSRNAFFKRFGGGSFVPYTTPHQISEKEIWLPLKGGAGSLHSTLKGMVTTGASV